MRWCLRFKYLKCKRALNVIVLFLLSLLITTAVFDHLRARPQRHKTHPGEFLRNNKPSNYTYCNFKHGLPEELAFEESDLEGTPEMGLSSRYKVLYNVLEATRQNSSSVTYSTHATVEFLDYISEIARSWDGPVSLAIFVPDSDAVPVISTLNVLCYCQPDMGKVSVHFVFPAELPPRLDSGVARPNNCSGVASNSSSVREAEGLIYPVNVCRNVAREAAATRFVLVADVQLIPSKGLAFKFLKMVASIDLNRRPSKVFVLPLFEVEEGENIPANKEELISMVRDERAVYFHRHVCSHCQKFPGIERWLETTDSGKVTPFVSVTREHPFHRWEPIYIGTKKEPFYSELLSWEGKQDKMTQMLEMCLMGYRFIILDGAFLVHWPGIKKKKTTKTKMENMHETRNSRQYDVISSTLSMRYPKNPKCISQ